MFNIKKLPILVEMSRPHGLITPLCACFCGLYLVSLGFPVTADLFDTFAIIIFVWFGGVILNDYFDSDVDSITDPYRPIPSGRITSNEALFSGITFLLAAVVLSLFHSLNLFLVTIMLIIFALLYNSRLKKRGLIGSICFGIIEGLSFTMGIYAIGDFNILTILVFVSIITLHTSVNMIGAIKDVEGDRKIGNLTVPVKYGINTTAKLIFLFIFISLIAALAPALLNLLNLRYLPLLIIICFWFIIINFQVIKNPKLGYMGFGMFYMGASVYYLNFITGI